MPYSPAFPSVADRLAIVDWYWRTRQRSTALFDMLDASAYYAQPIALRHPIVFYEGHLAAFSLNTLVKKALGRPGIDARLERLFARGIDPDDTDGARGAAPDAWPTRDEVRAFAGAADALVVDALEHADLDRPGVPLLEGGEAVYAIIEHEQMHQETMLYMWHRLPCAQKKMPNVPASVLPPPPEPRTSPSLPASLQRAPRLGVPAGRIRLGACRGDMPFGWDNEFEGIEVDVPAFAIDQTNVTNGAFLEFVEAGGYRDPRWWTAAAWQWLRDEHLEHPLFWETANGAWLWRSMFSSLPLPLDAPVYVSQAEAAAYCRWTGARLPTEAEYQRAAYGTPSGDERRPFPWGDEPADTTRAVLDFTAWDPQPVGLRPRGQSAWGVEDLVGNGWEWTSSVFAPFPGFEPLASYPQYSADFFDSQHYVMKGASPVTARELVRPTFRNWFRPCYPYVYATFRGVLEG
ncbi:MAG: SUMF1/EgtB/PvdO family nonheme iron enzyme [Bacteroidales bacterium]